MRSLGKRTVLLVVGGMDGILNSFTAITPHCEDIAHIMSCFSSKICIANARRKRYNDYNPYLVILDGEAMNCENRFCIYWNQNQCVLQKISLDGMGRCLDCSQVELPEEVLWQKRMETLMKYHPDTRQNDKQS